MKHAATLCLTGSLIGVFSATALALPAVMTMEVVEINGSTANLPSADLVVQPGDSLKIEFYLQDWAPALVKTYQLRLDGTSLASGTTGLIKLAELPCTEDEDCFGASACDGSLCECGGSLYIEQPNHRPGHLFVGRLAIWATDCTSGDALLGNYGIAGTLLSAPWGVPDDGNRKYLGTMWLEVGENAGGSFALGLLQNPDHTFLLDDDDQSIPLDWSATLTLHVGADDCNGNRIPDDQDITQGMSHDCQANGTPDECDIATGESADDNGDGVPDECQVEPVPAVSQWGIVILALMLLSAAKVRGRAIRRLDG